MPSLKDIRNRIDTTKNTQKITSALKMVSAAKLRRAQNNIVNLRPYARSLRSLIANIAESQQVSHTLLQPKETAKTALYVVVASDRGLCGSFNSSIAKYAEQVMKQTKSTHEKVDYLFVGRRVRDYFARRQIKPIDFITGLDKDISYDMAAGVADRVLKLFNAGDYDEVHLIYNEFKSAISQEVICERLLPIQTEAASDETKESSVLFSKDIIFEPQPEMIIEELLEKHFAVQVYRCLSESVAAEHGARMTAMENSTKNAGELIKSLTTTYNKLRQASITKELIEITTGAEALNG